MLTVYSSVALLTGEVASVIIQTEIVSSITDRESNGTGIFIFPTYAITNTIASVDTIDACTVTATEL